MDLTPRSPFVEFVLYGVCDTIQCRKVFVKGTTFAGQFPNSPNRVKVRTEQNDQHFLRDILYGAEHGVSGRYRKSQKTFCRNGN
jgi:hypothetical protein